MGYNSAINRNRCSSAWWTWGTCRRKELTAWLPGFLPALCGSSSYKPCSRLQWGHLPCQWCQGLSVTPLPTPPPFPNTQPGSEAPHPPKCRTSCLFVLPSCAKRRLVSCRFSLPPAEEPRPLPLPFLSCPHLCCTPELRRPCTDRPRGHCYSWIPERSLTVMGLRTPRLLTHGVASFGGKTECRLWSWDYLSFTSCSSLIRK